jgi:hypothetical protein
MSRQCFASFLIFMLFPCLVLAHTVAVTQGETVTLNLRIVNNAQQAITGLKASFDSNPRWLLPTDSSLTVDVTGKGESGRKPHVLLPFTFRVSRSAPPESSLPVTLRLADDKGNCWTKSIRFEVLPGKFLLRQNYPNPFNPETWIPYQITEDCDVTIRIFNSLGRLVRTLDLGYREAGFHLSKSDAAYWDGENDSGEEVSSGVYFYHLQAGKFSDVKKMLILR